MRRRFNYTGRQRVAHRKTPITIMQGVDDEVSFYMDLELEEYTFPDDAKIWIEVYDRNTIERFDFGTVSNKETVGARKLSGFKATDSFLFRIKVVDSLDNSRLLGLAKSVSAIGTEDEEDSGRSLLKVGIKSLNGRPWKLEIDSTEYPTLFIDREIDAGLSLARNNAFFQSIVFPAVIEEILNFILFEDEYEPSGNPENDDAWKEGWLNFCAELPGNSTISTDITDDGKEQWIDSAVESFCRQYNAIRKLRVSLKEIEA